ncbi:gamma-glutamyltranspeptidase [Longispora fulva]|uniref:gamma-glutamyltransferase n=1 Tax=Longispora fulva TaxID=619741 RepID=UPI0018C9DD70|nr:gamma-glutamyltranspeptidase [Longispora fulva]
MRTVTALALLATAVLAPDPALAAPPGKSPVAVGYGGAVATVDADATRIALDVLRDGGNAVDAAVAAAAALGVTEPFSAGVGGGGFLVYYDARHRTVHTLDGRETAPAATTETAFVNPATGKPYAFDEARVSGLSVGVPGTPQTWETALERWGTTDLDDALLPAARLADRGFVVDQTFADQVAANRAVFAQFDSTSSLYLRGGQPPAVGSVFRNPDLARTYRLLARDGADALYRGALAGDIARAVQHPPLATSPATPWPYPVRPGTLRRSDLDAYAVHQPAPTHVTYRGLDVYGMATPSSGGSTTGEALNILAGSDLAHLPGTLALHRYLEASALAFADRNRYVGDRTARPLLDELLNPDFAAERACRIDPARALPKPVAPGVPDGTYGGCAAAPVGEPNIQDLGTTNLTVADRWGNVVEYTLTIEATGGSGIVVPGRGFLLNNELTDFNFAPTQGGAPDPNLPGPGRRPRSSMAPTIVLSHGRPLLATGSPGGSTIITTVLQVLVNRLDLGMGLPEAIDAPRATQRNTASVQAEPGFPTAGLAALGHVFTANPEIGAATGVEFLRDGRVQAVAERSRRGGGAAAVVRPWPA